MGRSWIFLLSLVVLGCAAPYEAPAIDFEAERSALMEADKAWFESHKNIDEFLSSLTDDAIFMAEGAPAAEGEAIQALWEFLLSSPGFNLDWAATSADVAKAGDMGYTIGSYELTTAPDGVPSVTIGKYVTLWKKQADGSWKVAVDCFNSDGPPAG